MTTALDTAVGSGATAGSWRDRLERLAWRFPMPTRRFFRALAVGMSIVLAASGLLAGAVLTRNADTVDSARDSGLGTAQAATEFRTELAAADAQAAATLISGGLEDPQRRAAYDESVLRASNALTRAALVSQNEDVEDIEALSDGLLRFNGNVETSRANSRQGFPVGSAYLTQARTSANTDMVPRADRLRRSGEQRIAEAANSVGGPVSVLAVVALLVAVGVVIVGSALVAGRTRRLVQPVLAIALVVSVVGLVVVAVGVIAQSDELRVAAEEDLGQYVSANEVSSSLSNLRVTEIDAVAARGSGAALYDQFRADAAELQATLTSAPTDIYAELSEAVQRYVASVETVEETDTGGDNQGAAELTLTGGSSSAFASASAAASGVVDLTADALTTRFDEVDALSVNPLLPVALGLLAAGCAAGGVLARGRRYR